MFTFLYEKKQTKFVFLSPQQYSCSGSQSNGWIHLTFGRKTLDKQLNWSPHIDHVRRKARLRLRVLVSLMKRGRFHSISTPPTSGGYRCYKVSVFAILPVHHFTLVRGRFTRIWEFHSSRNTSEP
jgi:hypothetical protein